MALKDSIKIDMVSKLNPTVFQVLNQEVLGVSPARLGTTQSAVRRMTVEHEGMLKMLMPSILSVSPNDASWYKETSKYWNSFSLPIYPGGVPFEIGFIYDINDSERKEYINTLINKTTVDGKPTINTDADLKDYVLDKIPEFERYKYARPINTLDYLNWVFILGHHKVANKTTDITKSENIEFTLIDQRDILELKRAEHVLSNEALAKYLELIADRQKVKDILYINGDDPTVITEMDCDIKLKHLCESNPSKFLGIIKDPTMTTKARIERYIIKGILRRISGTPIIVDSADASVIIGNSLEEAVAYFRSESKDKAAKVQEFSTRYKSLKQQ